MFEAESFRIEFVRNVPNRPSERNTVVEDNSSCNQIDEDLDQNIGLKNTVMGAIFTPPSLCRYFRISANTDFAIRRGLQDVHVDGDDEQEGHHARQR